MPIVLANVAREARVMEFEFRYNNRVALGIEDTERTDALLKGIVGKRLTYETTSARA